MNTGRRFSRRSLVTGASAGAAAAALAGRGAFAHDGHIHAPTLLRYQTAAIPTPREQTLLIE